MLGCEVWEIEEYEARNQMREGDAAAEEDSDSGELSEESKQAVKPRAAKAKTAKAAAANREMPPSDDSSDDGPVTEVIPEEEEEKKGESDD